jgi:hypothetical protein
LCPHALESFLAACSKTLIFGKQLAVQGRTAIFNGCKLLKMGVFRKPRFSKDDVEKAMEGFFNRVLVQRFYTLIQAADC